jgi:hypothetical protein
MALVATPVSVFVAVIVTPGINAFEASSIVPVIVPPVPCANAVAVRNKHISTPVHIVVVLYFIYPLPKACYRSVRIYVGEFCVADLITANERIST